MGHQRAELHHYGRTDGQHLVDMLTVDHLFHANGDDSFLAPASVVGHDDDFITVFLHIIHHDDKFLCASCQDRDHSVAGFFQGGEDGKNSGYADAASGAEHGAVVLDSRRSAEWPHNVVHPLAHRQAAEFGRRQTHLLNHQGQGSPLGITLGYGVRHALTLAVYTNDDKVARAAASRNQRRFHLKAENLLAELLLAYDFVHT